MKLTMAMAVALVLCGGSLVARASIVHRRAIELRAEEAAAAAQTPAKASEQVAMNGVDTRLAIHLKHLAKHPSISRR